jgi:hypothetical protein
VGGVVCDAGDGIQDADVIIWLQWQSSDWAASASLGPSTDPLRGELG